MVSGKFQKGYLERQKRFLAWLTTAELATEYGRKALDMHIEQLTRLRGMLLEKTRVIRALSRTEAFAEPLRLITSVPGIGITTGISLLTEIDNIERFKNAEHLASYIGLVPMCHSSGEKQGVGGMTIRKHAALRSYLIEATWVAIRKDPTMTMAYAV